MNAPRTYSPATAYLLLVLVQALWASNLVVSRGLHETVPPVGLSFWRWFLAALIMLPLVWRSLPEEWPRIRASWRSIAILAAFMIGGSTLAIASVTFTTATNASLVNATQPAMMAFFAWLVLRDRLTAIQGAGIAAAAIGIVVMVIRADWSVLATLGINGGDLLMVAGVVGYSLYGTYYQKLPTGISPMTFLFVVFLVGSLEIIPFYALEGIVYMPFPLELKSLGAAAFLAFAPSVLAVFFWNAGLRTVGVNRAAIFVNLLPVFGAAMAIAFLGERLFLYHVLGAALVCVGIVLVVRGHRHPAAGATDSARRQTETA